MDFVAVQAESCCSELHSLSSGAPPEGWLVERRETVEAGSERPGGRPAEKGAIVDVSLRGSAAPPHIAAPAPPQLNDVGVQHGLAVALQGPVAITAQCRAACRCARHVRGVRSHAARGTQHAGLPATSGFPRDSEYSASVILTPATTNRHASSTVFCLETPVFVSVSCGARGVRSSVVTSL